jgi:hypothetical protein
MGYAIWTFDLVKRYRPDDSPLKALLPQESPDLVLYENCPEDWTQEQADERALGLAMRHRGVYLVRWRNEAGFWSPPTAEQWKAGVTHVEQVRREQAAIARRKRQLKKLKQYYE